MKARVRRTGLRMSGLTASRVTLLRFLPAFLAWHEALKSPHRVCSCTSGHSDSDRKVEFYTAHSTLPIGGVHAIIMQYGCQRRFCWRMDGYTMIVHRKTTGLLTNPLSSNSVHHRPTSPRHTATHIYMRTSYHHTAYTPTMICIAS
ncbi:hypothetical protein BDZ97DRAFT_1816196 [Flammula alnicola]|nr:hypothetical protein BDZ97DRAFT_1816196 [Flammula alnicola]